MRVSVRKNGSASGKVINVPAAFEELVDEARKELGITDVPCILLTEKGDVIDSLSVLRDGDIIYLRAVRADGQNVNPASSSRAEVVAEVVAAEIGTIFGPYTHGPFNPSPSARRRVPGGRRPSSTVTASTSGRHVQHVINKRVVVLKKMALPATRRADNVVLDGQIIFEKNERDIRHHITELLRQKFPSIPESADISLLRCTGKQMSRPTLPSTFTWSGHFIAKYVGQGSLYVQLASDIENSDSDDDLPMIELRSRTQATTSRDAPLPTHERPSEAAAAVDSNTRPQNQENPNTSMEVSRHGTVDLTGTESVIVETRPHLSSRNNLLSLTHRRQQTTCPTASMSFDFLQNPSNVMALYDDDEFAEADIDHRDSDVITLNTGPSIKDMLESMAPTEVGFLRIMARRGHLLEDTLQRLRRCNVAQFGKPLKVTFIGEEAEDEGGPRRELFTLCLAELSTSQYFCGKTLTHNGELRLQKMYRAIGWLMVLSLTQGGPAPKLFSPGVVRHILQLTPQTGLEDMGMLQGSMLQLMNMSTTEQLRANVDNLFESRFDMGYSKPSSTILSTDLPNMLSVLSYHIAVESCHSELEQLCEGLKLLGFLDKARAHPGRMSSLLETGEESRLTAEILDNTFVKSFSDVGTNNRIQEEAVVVHFNNFLLDVEAKEVSTPITGFDGEETIYTIQLEDILFFVTCCTEVPPMGYRQPNEPQLVFDHIRPNCLPRANTCACILFIPMNAENTTYEGLRKNLVFSICGSPGFGQR